MYPPMDRFSKARQDELLRTANRGHNPSLEQVDILRPKGQGFIQRLISALSRRKTLHAARSDNSRKECHELEQA